MLSEYGFESFFKKPDTEKRAKKNGFCLKTYISIGEVLKNTSSKMLHKVIDWNKNAPSGVRKWTAYWKFNRSLNLNPIFIIFINIRAPGFSKNMQHKNLCNFSKKRSKQIAVRPSKKRSKKIALRPWIGLKTFRRKKKTKKVKIALFFLFQSFNVALSRA